MSRSRRQTPDAHQQKSLSLSPIGPFQFGILFQTGRPRERKKWKQKEEENKTKIDFEVKKKRVDKHFRDLITVARVKPKVDWFFVFIIFFILYLRFVWFAKKKQERIDVDETAL